MAVCSSKFFETIGKLQQKLHDSERKRLELERKLFETSDQRLSKLKQIKLRNYLKGICERERKAVLRNREFQKDFERVEAHIAALTTSTDKLRHMKIEYEKEIERRMTLWKNEMKRSQKRDASSDQALQLSRLVGTDTETNLSKGLYQPATIFMGRQMSGSSSIEPFSTQQKSHLPTESFSVSSQYSHRQAAKSNSVTDSSVLQANNTIPLLNKSDKKDGSTYLQTREKMPLTSSISFENGTPHSSGIETSNNIRNSSMVESREAGEPGSQLPSPQERLTPRNGISDLKESISGGKMRVEVEFFKVNENLLEYQLSSSLNSYQNSQSRSEPLLKKHDTADKHPVADQKYGQNNAWSKQNAEELEDEIFDTDSDLTVSISESEELEGPLDSIEPQQKLEEKSDTMNILGSACTKQEIRTPSRQGSSSSVVHTLDLHGVPHDTAVDSSTGEYCLSFEGFFHLLQSVEDIAKKAGPVRFRLYQTTTARIETLKEIIRLCNQKEHLNGEDLEACGAVVLQQLQRLSQSTSNGCLLPEQALVNSWSSTDESQIRSALPSDSVMLWEHWYRHAVFLAEHHILSRDEIAELFGPLLTAAHSEKSNEATVLLKKILPEEAEESVSIHSNESSCSLPSILNDGGEIKQAKPAQWLYSTATQEQGGTSCNNEDDDDDESSDESFVKNVPITETKAYQLLKQSVVQHSSHLIEEDEKDISELELPGMEKSSINITIRGKENVASEPSSSSAQESPPPRSGNFKRGISAVKSKAFWGESDDSNSDIEAALRPQMPTKDDFDDFYD